MEGKLLTKFLTKMKKRGNAISYSLTKGEKGWKAMTKPHDRNKKNKEQEQNQKKNRERRKENGKPHMTKEILDNKNTSKHRTETNTARRTVTPTNTHQTPQTCINLFCPSTLNHNQEACSLQTPREAKEREEKLNPKTGPHKVTRKERRSR